MSILNIVIYNLNILIFKNIVVFTSFFETTFLKHFNQLSSYTYTSQGCQALRKISGSPSGSQAFYLTRPDLK